MSAILRPDFPNPPALAHTVAADKATPASPSAGVANFPVGTRVRNKRTGELGTVVEPRSSTVTLKDIAVVYDDCPDDSWSTKPSAVEVISD